MNFQKLFYLMLFLMIVTGYSNETMNEEQEIEVQKRVGNDYNYEDFRNITDAKQVRKVNEILNESDWEKVKIEMSRAPDYQFVFQFKNPDIKSKAILHKIWVSSDKDTIQILKQDNQYTQLTNENAATLLEIIIGDNLNKEETE
ncbi:hypothetical protein ABET51_18140 [Metabacillus fastidiosus]|uniref:hypothetical protein n=1 Tax=Metabacillus fastidiosus TaxID=1458 RepID=UPI003D26C442